MERKFIYFIKFQAQVEKLVGSLIQFKNLISQKASIEQLILVESKFKEYTEDQEFQELKFNMKNYTELDTHKFVKIFGKIIA